MGEALVTDAQCSFAQLSAQFHDEGYAVDLDTFWTVHMYGLSSRDEARAVFAAMREPRFRLTRMGALILTSPTYNVDSERRTRTVLMGSACHVTDSELNNMARGRVAASDVHRVFEANRMIHSRLDGRVPAGDSVLRFFLDLADRAPYSLRTLFGTTSSYSNTHWGSRHVLGIIPIPDDLFQFLLSQRDGPYKLLDLTDERVREAICRLFDRYPRVGYQYLRELYCVRLGEWDPAPRFE